jgi:hypothetical protein
MASQKNLGVSSGIAPLLLFRQRPTSADCGLLEIRKSRQRTLVIVGQIVRPMENRTGLAHKTLTEN